MNLRNHKGIFKVPQLGLLRVTGPVSLGSEACARAWLNVATLDTDSRDIVALVMATALGNPLLRFRLNDILHSE